MTHPGAVGVSQRHTSHMFHFSLMECSSNVFMTSSNLSLSSNEWMSDIRHYSFPRSFLSPLPHSWATAVTWQMKEREIHMNKSWTNCSACCSTHSFSGHVTKARGTEDQHIVERDVNESFLFPVLLTEFMQSCHVAREGTAWKWTNRSERTHYFRVT